VPQPVHAGFRYLRAPSRVPHVVLHHLLRERVPVGLAEHALAPQVSMGLKRRGEPGGQRHVAQPPALGRRHVPLPVGALHAELPLPQVHVAPLECQRNQWHDYLGDPTVADAVLDRPVHNAYTVALKGLSRRKEKTDKAEKMETRQPARRPRRFAPITMAWTE
jgi:hypothetical protein